MKSAVSVGHRLLFGSAPTLAFLFAAALGEAVPAQTAEEATPQPTRVAEELPVEDFSELGWLERTHLTGDWGRPRTTLADHGVVLGARYTAGFWSNVRGGFQTGTRYEGFVQWWLYLRDEMRVKECSPASVLVCARILVGCAGIR